MDAALKLLKELVAIESVNPSLVSGAAGEGDVADAAASCLRRAGLDVERQEAAPGRPNVIGVLEGRERGRSLMFCGHLDTVGVAGMSSPFTPAERDGRIYGRGAQDMKGGVAAMMDAARVLAAQGFRRGPVNGPRLKSYFAAPRSLRDPGRGDLHFFRAGFRNQTHKRFGNIFVPLQ